jgi:tRNA(fMet)-specific endonuclease VapC
MGVVLDSSALISAERDGRPVSVVLAELEKDYGETEIVLSSITVVELEHGLHRADNPARARQRREYLDVVFAAVPVEPFIKEMGQTAAKLDADARQTGKVIPFADLLIGATALYYDYAVGTRNLRHFQMVPGLKVLRL